MFWKVLIGGFLLYLLVNFLLRIFFPLLTFGMVARKRMKEMEAMLKNEQQNKQSTARSTASELEGEYVDYEEVK